MANVVCRAPQFFNDIKNDILSTEIQIFLKQIIHLQSFISVLYLYNAFGKNKLNKIILEIKKRKENKIDFSNFMMKKEGFYFYKRKVRFNTAEE